MPTRLTLFYSSGWTNPVWHHGFEGVPAWGDATFARVVGEPNWWQVTVEMRGPCVEFVIRAQDSSGWDKAPDGSNYKLGPLAGDHAVAVLRHGETSIVDLDRPPWALVADMDGTLIGEPVETVERLLRFWDLHCRFAVRPSDGVRLCQLAYNSGRNRKDMLNGCREFGLPRPDFMICGVGTEIYRPYPPSELGDDVAWYDAPQPPEVDPLWKLTMEREFGDRDALAAEVAARFPQLEIHGSIDHDPYRLPCVARLTPECPGLLEELQAWGDEHPTLRVIISGVGDARFVDICSVHADKGLAVEHLFGAGGFRGITDRSRIIVAGDSGNDLRMFMVPGIRSVMVGNSQEPLVQAVFGSNQLAREALDGRGLPVVVERPSPLLEVYYAQGVVGDGVCEAIMKYYYDGAAMA